MGVAQVAGGIGVEGAARAGAVTCGVEGGGEFGVAHPRPELAGQRDGLGCRAAPFGDGVEPFDL